MSPHATVIVPVLDDREGLQRCLPRLRDQSFPDDAYEVVVVDNGSEDEPDDLVKGMGPNFRYATEPRPGSYTARNEGVRKARGSVLAFTDADCLPQPRWLENGVERVTESPEIGLVGGKITVFSPGEGAPTPWDVHNAVQGFRQRDYIERRGFAATANAFTTKAVMDEVGGFDASLKSGGDFDFGNRVRQQGYGLVYEETAEVRHPSRRTFSEHSKKIARIRRGMYDRSYEPHKNPHLYVLPLRKWRRLMTAEITTSEKLKGGWAALVLKYVHAYWSLYWAFTDSTDG